MRSIGKRKALTRGALCTSIDAMMVGEQLSGKRKLFLIEWKYTETYGVSSKSEGKSGKRRVDAYRDLLNSKECPIVGPDFDGLYYEPFYQLMRQTLLGWQMTIRKEYGCNDWVHLHVIPLESRVTKYYYVA